MLVESNLQTLSAFLEDAISHVRKFSSDGAVGHLVNANRAMDNAIGTFVGFLLPSSVDDLAGLRSAVTTYRTTMSHELALWGKIAADARDKMVDLGEKAEALEKRVTDEQEKLQSAVDEVTAAANVARKETSEKFESIITDLHEKAEAELSTFKAELDEEREAQAKTHNEAMETRQSTFDEDFAKTQGALKSTEVAWEQRLSEVHAAHSAEVAKLRADYLEKGAGMITTMEGQLKRVQELVGAIGDHGVTAGFKREADDARKEVSFWQRLALGSMIFLVGVGLATAFHLKEEVPTWISLAGRLYLSIAIGVLAAYAANQANRYQQRERRNRKLELELRALGPFLEPVDPAEREKFRLKIAEVFFGQEDRVVDKPGPTTPLELTKDSVDKLLDVTKALVEKLPGR